MVNSVVSSVTPKGCSFVREANSASAGHGVQFTAPNLCTISSSNQSLPIPAVPAERVGKINRWIADTGSGHDVVNELHLSELGHRRKTALTTGPQDFHTAGGPTSAAAELKFYSKALGGQVRAILLENSPNLISVGKRCMRQGYSFHWYPHRAPYFVHPKGHYIKCKVEGDIPYVIESEGVLCPLPSDDPTEIDPASA